MEPMLLSVVILLSGLLGLVFLIVAFLTDKKKSIRKLLFIFSVLSFSLPLIILLGTKLSAGITQSNFEGTYIGKDSLSNEVLVDIKEGRFKVSVENCDEASVEGTYNYVNEYDAFLFYAEKGNVSMNYDETGKLFLSSDIKTACTKLNEIILEKR